MSERARGKGIKYVQHKGGKENECAPGMDPGATLKVDPGEKGGAARRESSVTWRGKHSSVPRVVCVCLMSRALGADASNKLILSIIVIVWCD